MFRYIGADILLSHAMLYDALPLQALPHCHMACYGILYPLYDKIMRIKLYNKNSDMPCYPLPCHAFSYYAKAMPNQTSFEMPCHSKLCHTGIACYAGYIIYPLHHAHKAMQWKPCYAMLSFTMLCLFMLCKSHAMPSQTKPYYACRYDLCLPVCIMKSFSLANPSFSQFLHLSAST